MKIRSATPADAHAVIEIYAPYVLTTAVSFEEEPPTIDEMAGRIQQSCAWLVAEDDEGIHGLAYAAPFHRRPAYRWSVEVSIYLEADATGQGLGKRLLADLLDELRDGGYVNAFAGTTLPNPASITLFESFGFEKVAHQRMVGFKLGRWHDVGWWQLHIVEPSVPPPELR